MKKNSDEQILNLSKRIKPLILLKSYIMEIEPESLTTPFYQIYNVKNRIKNIVKIAKIKIVCNGKDAEHPLLSAYDVLSQLPSKYHDEVVGYSLPVTRKEIVEAYNAKKSEFVLKIQIYAQTT